MFKKYIYGLIVLLAVNAPAQYLTQGKMEFGAYGGYATLDSFSQTEPKDAALYGLRFGIFASDKTSFELAYQMLPTEALTTSNAKLNTLNVNYMYHFFRNVRFTPTLTLGMGWLRTDIDPIINQSNDLAINTGLGFKVFFSENWAFRADARYVYAEVLTEHQQNYEFTGGISYLTGGHKDADKDKVRDNVDQCLKTPMGAKVDNKGCGIDMDKDGVFDGIDQCNKTPQGAKVDTKGCGIDTDKDGVFDGIDQCENSPAGSKVNEKGCLLDADEDGVEDKDDACPDTPNGIAVNEKGCPRDSDKDGVSDVEDLCPNTEQGQSVDIKGCPQVVKSRGVLKGVNFKSGSSELTLNSMVILEDVAKELLEFPRVRIEIQGHTDSVGAAEFNQKISYARAKSVMTYLVSKGVPQDRMVAKGYGESQPIASNKTAGGRAQNRRVELKWVD
ncbi:OmpA family protein [bacterium]|nr:OmpA family protein [bacterium]